VFFLDIHVSRPMGLYEDRFRKAVQDCTVVPTFEVDKYVSVVVHAVAIRRRRLLIRAVFQESSTGL
jgi:hypothetical protein